LTFDYTIRASSSETEKRLVIAYTLNPSWMCYHRYFKSVFREPYKVVHLDSRTTGAIAGCEEKLEDYIQGNCLS